MTQWIWQQADWPQFIWDAAVISPHLAAARSAQGRLLGVVQTINPDLAEEIDIQVLEDQATDTSAIEGEVLNRDSVRSSIANRLGVEQAGLVGKPDRYLEGLLDMLLDATQHYKQPLTLNRLCGWHAALFPTGYSGMHPIQVGLLRENDSVQVVSGRPGREKVHYQAPPAKLVATGIGDFLRWFNEVELDGLLRAGVAHVWFELLHPFEDGNGRVGRAMIDLALAQDEKLSMRYYSLSSAIMEQRKGYYACLEKTCQGGLDITDWLCWFLGCFVAAIDRSMQLVDDVSLKSRFWQRHAKTALNERQLKVLGRLLDAGKDGFEGHMSTRKYMQIAKTSRATAYRELADLVQKGCLQPTKEKGRSAAYDVCWVPRTSRGT
jgi:Fic family protein